MQLNEFLNQMVLEEASDLYVTTGTKASIRINGKIKAISDQTLEPGFAKELAYSIMSDEQKVEFEKKLEMNLALSRKQLGRFRVNIFVQRSEVAMVIRRIHTAIPTLEKLGLPSQLQSLIMEKRGLILFVGATGSGKSSSVASLINYRNDKGSGHIITIEDPIEFIHTHKNCIINQREVGIDTQSYEDALENTLRQAPDVILVGEIRTRNTMEQSLFFCETGHLCISTLHANNANQAIDRIINFFPEDRKKQILLDLSLNLKAIISQRLIPSIQGQRVAAIEILLSSPLVASLIQRGDVNELKSLMEKSALLGMQTFDQSLEKLYFEGKITQEEAIQNADSKNNVKLNIQLKSHEKSKQDASLSANSIPHSPLSLKNNDSF